MKTVFAILILSVIGFSDVTVDSLSGRINPTHTDYSVGLWFSNGRAILEHHVTNLDKLPEYVKNYTGQPFHCSDTLRVQHTDTLYIHDTLLVK